MYTGKTKKLGVLGYPVEHSLSPYIHNTYLQAKGMDYMYMALPVKPEKLGEYLPMLQDLGFVGLNLTIPHKVEVLKYLTKVDAGAKAIGAVNTLVLNNGNWEGYNTDGFGFAYPLQGEQGLQGGTAVLLGCGGAARAVIYALAELQVKKFFLVVRNKAKGNVLVEAFPNLQIEVVELGANDHCCWQMADIVINTTPLGMTGVYAKEVFPLPWESLKPQAILYDLIYTPVKTQFLLTGEARGHRIINGVAMLAAQGAKALALWSKEEIDIPFMVKTLEVYLAKD